MASRRWLSGDRENTFGHSDCAGGVLDTLATHYMHSGMKVAVAKTELMVIRGRTALRTAAVRPAQVHFAGETLQPMTTARNLGVVAKCFEILVGFMHAKHLIPIQALSTIADAPVMSHPRYCIFRGV